MVNARAVLVVLVVNVDRAVCTQRVDLSGLRVIVVDSRYLEAIC